MSSNEEYPGLDLVLDGVEPVSPPPSLRDRLLASVRPTDAFIERLAEMFAIDTARAEALLEGAEARSLLKGWIPAFPGVRLRPIRPGAGSRGTQGALIWVEGNGHFPMHRHKGEETLLIISGSCVDQFGGKLAPGDVIVSQDGSAHSFDVCDDEPLLAAVVGNGASFL